VQDEQLIGIGMAGAQYAADAIAPSQGDKPQDEEQRRNAGFGCVLDVEVVQVAIVAGRQGALNVGGYVGVELTRDLAGPQAKPGMRFHHLHAGAEGDHAEAV
jgi:hypothetical protein